MATGGSKLSEVCYDLEALQESPGMYGSGGGEKGKSSNLHGEGGGAGPTFKAPSRSGSGGSKRKGSSKTHSEE